MSNRAMHADPQISLQGMVPPFNSSGGAMIHRLCTDHFIRGKVSDKIQCINTSGCDIRDSTNGDLQCKEHA